MMKTIYRLYVKDTISPDTLWYYKMDKDRQSVWANIILHSKEFRNIEVVKRLIEHLRNTEAGQTQEFHILSQCKSTLE